MADVADELNRIIQYLAGLKDRLELGSLVLVYQVLVQIKAGSGQQRAGIIMKIGCQTLAIFLLQPDGGIQQNLLLFLLHILQAKLVPYNFPLVEDNEEDQADSKGKHS